MGAYALALAGLKWHEELEYYKKDRHEKESIKKDSPPIRVVQGRIIPEEKLGDAPRVYEPPQLDFPLTETYNIPQQD